EQFDIIVVFCLGVGQRGEHRWGQHLAHGMMCALGGKDKVSSFHAPSVKHLFTNCEGQLMVNKRLCQAGTARDKPDFSGN
ncbi:MAG: hypothetical protein ABI395_11075, partial [Sphingobium sp.]